MKFFNTPTQPDTPQIRLDTPQIRLDTHQIRLDTTLSDKSKWIPYPHQRLQTGVIGVSLVSKQYHEKQMQQYQLTQQNLNQIKAEKIATSPQEDKEKYVEKYMIYYAVV